jgi:hypothetical protein
MADGLRRLNRQEYLRKHAEQRRSSAKAEGARRIDVTLRGEMLADYASVRSYIEGLNRWFVEHNHPQDRFRLSDTEVIKMALRCAATAIREDEEQARRQGLR